MPWWLLFGGDGGDGGDRKIEMGCDVLAEPYDIITGEESFHLYHQRRLSISPSPQKKNREYLQKKGNHQKSDITYAQDQCHLYEKEPDRNISKGRVERVL